MAKAALLLEFAQAGGLCVDVVVGVEVGEVYAVGGWRGAAEGKAEVHLEEIG
jgi:hypothetical protein